MRIKNLCKSRFFLEILVFVGIFFSHFSDEASTLKVFLGGLYCSFFAAISWCSLLLILRKILAKWWVSGCVFSWTRGLRNKRMTFIRGTQCTLSLCAVTRARLSMNDCETWAANARSGETDRILIYPRQNIDGICFILCGQVSQMLLNYYQMFFAKTFKTPVKRARGNPFLEKLRPRNNNYNKLWNSQKRCH